MRLLSVQLYFPERNEQSSNKKGECTTLLLQVLLKRMKFERDELLGSVQLYCPHTVDVDGKYCCSLANKLVPM